MTDALREYVYAYSEYIIHGQRRGSDEKKEAVDASKAKVIEVAGDEAERLLASVTGACDDCISYAIKRRPEKKVRTNKSSSLVTSESAMQRGRISAPDSTQCPIKTIEIGDERVIFTVDSSIVNVLEQFTEESTVKKNGGLHQVTIPRNQLAEAFACIVETAAFNTGKIKLAAIFVQKVAVQEGIRIDVPDDSMYYGRGVIPPRGR